MVTEADLELSDGRTLHYYDTHGDGQDARTAVFWHHGTPNVGSPPEPLFPAAAENGLRWVSYDRPAYGGSSPNPGRDIASAAGDVAAIADALGIGRFAALGHSGGGPHALACGALLPERVIAVVSVSASAPFDAEGLDWFAGWSPSGVAEQRAALAGRAALQAYLSQIASEGTANGTAPEQGGQYQTVTGKIAQLGWDITGGQKYWYVTLDGQPGHVYVGTVASVGPALVLAQPGDSVTITFLNIGTQSSTETMQSFTDTRVPLHAPGA